MKNRLKQWLPFLIGGVVLAWYLSRLNWVDMWHALGQVNYWWIAPIVALNLASLVLRAFRWQLFLAGTKRIKIMTVYNITAIGFMLNCILPGRLGEILKPLMLKRKEGVSFSAALGTCFTERVYDLVTVLLILSITLLVIPIDPNLTVPFTRDLEAERTAPVQAQLTDLAGYAGPDGGFNITDGTAVLDGESGRLVRGQARLEGDALQLTNVEIRFPQETIVYHAQRLTFDAPPQGESGLPTQAVGELTPVKKMVTLDVRGFVRNGGISFGILCVVMMAVLLLLAYAPNACVRLATWMVDLTRRIVEPIVKRDLMFLQDKIVSSAQKFAHALSIFHQPLPFLMSLVYTAGIWICIMLTEYLLFVAFDLAEVGLSGAWLLTAILALSVAAPQLPGYLGTFQVACLLTLAILGIQAAGVADAYANLLWLVQILPIVLAGFVALHFEGMSLAQVRKMESSAEATPATPRE